MHSCYSTKLLVQLSSLTELSVHRVCVLWNFIRIHPDNTINNYRDYNTVEPLNNGRNWDDCFCPLNGGCPLFRGYCKVAGSNLTCWDDWKTRWQLHSVDLTSMPVSLLGQNIILSPVARVVYG